MKNSIRSELIDFSSNALACNHEIILKITCNKIVSVSKIYKGKNSKLLIFK